MGDDKPSTFIASPILPVENFEAFLAFERIFLLFKDWQIFPLCSGGDQHFSFG